MCGICGIYNFDSNESVNPDLLEAMNRQIIHRGPDDEGFYVARNVGLAMRRLSIIDVASGHQPMTNEDSSLWLVFNGEIYNHQELRPDLEARGHHYRTRSDTETILHLFEEYGRDCVRYLRGMFAFVIWDARRRRLFAARDRLGIKPFYYRLDPHRFLFGSEIKTLLSYPGIRAELNRTVIPEYLAFGYMSSADTMFRSISKLMPGHTLEVDEAGQSRIEPYWDLTASAENDSRPRQHYVTRYRDMLEQAVSSHLMSDVPLGVFLSGGLDSSVVAALTSKLRADPIETFSVGYEESGYSELPFARQVASHIGSIHHEIRIGWKEFMDSLPRLIWHEDEPIVWPSSVALFFVSKLARERVTVVLTGEGSDETLAGYTRYAWTLWNARLDNGYRKLVPPALRAVIRKYCDEAGLLPLAVERRLRHTFLARDGASWPSFYFDNFYSVFSASAQQELLADDLRPSPGAAYKNSLAYWNKSSGDLLHRLLYTDIKTYLIELLMKQDNMSMAASIESRVPFLDHILVEFTAGIPASFETQGLSGKCILKSAAADLLPSSIIYRKKMGFPTPLRAWLAGPQLDQAEQLLLEPRALEWGIFKPQAVRRLLAEHRNRIKDHYERIWRLMNLEIWRRVFLDRDPAYLPGA
ncbi:MAG TPA: asparagine synthase (glutamine-hydrolyzing) [Terriglobia bacterium]|nr:asparagine synthase (glutamine-hydrolyzing) [Terriglobia bacterium]